MIPDFDSKGNLPPGIHQTTWDEFEKRFGHNYYRKRLIRGMKGALSSLKKAGCETVYIDGSFVTNKNRPKDYDGCWDPTGVNFDSLDPVLKDFRPGRTAQKIKFFGELFISSKHSEKGTMLDFFQNDRDCDPKGIVAIDLGDFNDQE